MQNLFTASISPLWNNGQPDQGKIDPRQRAWLEVDSAAIQHNARALKTYIGKKCILMAVVKADGYGHGAKTVASAALKGGASCLGVATLQEGIELRECGLICPILILGNLTNIEELGPCLDWDLMPTLSSAREALLCQNIAESRRRKFKVHVKVDTGMTRLGCDFIDAFEFIEVIKSLRNLVLKGIYSHLALADGDVSTDAEAITSLQKQRFESLLNNLQGTKDSICIHFANSSGTLRDSKLHYDMVRVGLALYGYLPRFLHKESLDLKPAMKVKAKVSFVRNVPTNTGVGYGHQFITDKDSRLAVVGIGYADGVSRSLSGRISVLCQEKFVPQVGAIAMDQLVLDISNHPEIKVGDVVTLLGEDGDQKIDPQQWSDISGSIVWEVLCGFKNRLPRLVI